MILEHYLRNRLLSYFFLINGSLTILYNLIEFIEKIMRQTNSSILEVALFIALNILPTFFELIPLSSWLATCMLIWELYQRNEWEIFNLLSIGKTKTIRFLLPAGILLSLLSFVGKELAVQPITRLARRYKMETFKAQSNNTLLNAWFSPQKNLFMHFDYLDLKTNTGTGLLMFYMSENFKAEKKLEAERFSLERPSNKILFKEGSSLNIMTSESSNLKNYETVIPGLFMHIKMLKESPSFKRQIQNLITAKNLSIHFPFNQELGKLLAKAFSHIQPLIYILLTFCLFFIGTYPRWCRWALIATPYPVLLILKAMCNFLIGKNAHASIVAIPYLLSLGTILACRYKLKNSDFYRKTPKSSNS